MRPVDLVAWSESLGVDLLDVPAVLAKRASHLEQLHHDLAMSRASLCQAPDEELVMQLNSATRVLADAATRLGYASKDAQRTAR